MDIIDFKDGMERVQNDAELLLELFDIFTEDFPPKYASFQKAFQDKDCAAFRTIVHGFKGATGNISAARMYANCIALDAIAKTGEISATGPAVELLGAQFNEFVAEAARIRKMHDKGAL